jgi:hypothetical protein
MKYKRICGSLALIITLTLLIMVPATPTHAITEHIGLYPNQGRIGDWIEVDGWYFESDKLVAIYLSSEKAEEGELFGEAITVYEEILKVSIDSDGDFTHTYHFQVPDALTDGDVIEDVHGGYYYVYAAYYPHDDHIVEIRGFTVLNGEIELDLEEGIVGTEVTINGEGLRPEQQITVTYDEEEVAIASGDSQTDDEGSFTCTIIVPESTFGSHTITVTDVSGNNPDAEFTVQPAITIHPPTQAAGKEVNVSGTGFGRRKIITINFDDSEVPTTPDVLSTDSFGSFACSFLVPFRDSLGTSTIEAIDSSCDTAEAQLTVLAGISMSPITSLTSPGHVGIELDIHGVAFTPNTTIDITYSNNDETIPIATDSTDGYGSFQVYLTIPPSSAGDHDITASDGTSTATVTFIMESQPPSMPTPLLPEGASTAQAETYFQWEGVDDISQPVTYTLQVAADSDFTNIVLEKKGLTTSEYTLTVEEQLASTERDAPYYWRVKAVDAASNESEWTYPISFYVGVSWTKLPVWLWYILGGLGVVLIGILGLWWRRRRAKK